MENEAVKVAEVVGTEVAEAASGVNLKVVGIIAGVVVIGGVTYFVVKKIKKNKAAKAQKAETEPVAEESNESEA